jgi:hypothetical protein
MQPEPPNAPTSPKNPIVPTTLSQTRPNLDSPAAHRARLRFAYPLNFSVTISIGESISETALPKTTAPFLQQWG